MDRKSFEDMECPIARATDQLGDPWALLILRSAFLGTRCFQDFEQRLGVPASTLTRKLRELCELGLLRRERYQNHPPRNEYRLTDKGADLLPLFVCLAVWGGRWASPRGPALVVVDTQSGTAVEPVLVDAKTGRRLDACNVAVAVGPGASRQLRRSLARPIPLNGGDAP